MHPEKTLIYRRCNHLYHLHIGYNPTGKLSKKKSMSEKTKRKSMIRTQAITTGRQEETRRTCSTCSSVTGCRESGIASTLSIRATYSIETITIRRIVGDYGFQTNSCTGGTIITGCAIRRAGLTFGTEESGGTGLAGCASEAGSTLTSSSGSAHA